MFYDKYRSPFVAFNGNPNFTFISEGDGVFPALSAEDWKRALDTRPDPSVTVINIAFKDPWCRHYADFMRTIICLYAVKRLFYPNARVNRIYAGKIAYDWSRADSPQGQLLHLFFPGAEIDNTDVKKEDKIHHWIFFNLSSLVKYLDIAGEHAITFINQYSDDFVSAVWKYCGATPVDAPFWLEDGYPSRRLRILYAKRWGGRRRLLKDLEDYLLEILSRYGDITITNFGKNSFKEQVCIAAQHDLIIGVHGNDLANAIWLPPHGALIELALEDCKLFHFQVFMEQIKRRYFGVYDDKLVTNGCRFGRNQSQYLGRDISKLNFDYVEMALQQVFGFAA
ncbi:MAG: glycosyltransferase family 61 protein [Verrucomicrobiales bacterium]|jgi:hypothetical protein|nr:glycosyltransferase family 61 protein [Verrucomicrobiales bacterium]